MSDDYDDEDEPGGLWDPDAFADPPEPGQPALRLITTQGTADHEDRPADSNRTAEDADAPHARAPGSVQAG
jgi:hypothetical protein